MDVIGKLNISGMASIAAGEYFYYRGDADTDGSVRISSQVAGELLIEQRTGGVWAEIELGGGFEYVTAPDTPTSTGTQGQFAYSGNYLYVCVATDTWVRCAAESTWS
jgi:hypothetical protein